MGDRTTWKPDERTNEKNESAKLSVIVCMMSKNEWCEWPTTNKEKEQKNKNKKENGRENARILAFPYRRTKTTIYSTCQQTLRRIPQPRVASGKTEESPSLLKLRLLATSRTLWRANEHVLYADLYSQRFRFRRNSLFSRNTTIRERLSLWWFSVRNIKIAQQMDNVFREKIISERIRAFLKLKSWDFHAGNHCSTPQPYR